MIAALGCLQNRERHLLSISRFATFGIIAVLLISIAGCGTAPLALYQWESYQPQIYEYFKGQGAGSEAQINTLEQGLQKIRAKGNNPPPGYHAHLGLLYGQIGKEEQFIQQLNTEKSLFPESAAYIDFLLRKQKVVK